jgi:hypothetical protein
MTLALVFTEYHSLYMTMDRATDETLANIGDAKGDYAPFVPTMQYIKTEIGVMQTRLSYN